MTIACQLQEDDGNQIRLRQETVYTIMGYSHCHEPWVKQQAGRTLSNAPLPCHRSTKYRGYLGSFATHNHCHQQGGALLLVLTGIMPRTANLLTAYL